jgi:hypothetical protein
MDIKNGKMNSQGSFNRRGICMAFGTATPKEKVSLSCVVSKCV